MPILDVALRICQKQWTIGRGGERGSELSVLITRHYDDNDDDLIFGSLYVHVSVTKKFKTKKIIKNMYTIKSNISIIEL